MQTALNYSQNPTPQSMAYGLASLGRYGDSYMVHAAEGETVIPAEILLANPQLKADLFRQMQMMGIKDPNRYVVGNTLNSLNPVTGQPEFFFKKILNAFKAVAPVVLAAIGNKIAPGLGGILGAAGGRRLQGGSWSDAARAGAMTYAGEIAAGGGRAAYGDPAQGGFFGGAMAAAQRPFQAIRGLFPDRWGTTANTLAQGMLGPYLPGTKEAAATFRQAYPKPGIYPQFRSPEEISAAGVESAAQFSQQKQADLAAHETVMGPLTQEDLADWQKERADIQARQFPPPPSLPWGQLAAITTLPVGAELLFGGDGGDGGDEGDAREIGDPAYAEYIRSQGEIPGSEAFYEARRGAGISRGTVTPEILAQTTGLSIDQAREFLARKYGRVVAGGGEIMGAGTGTSDSIPARLSDGEFVMTADAVRGAGNGSRDLGAARMYDLMSQFERTV
jgi:hypothetical protein